MSEPIDIRQLNAQIEAETGFITDLVEGMNRTIVGQKHLINSLLIGLLADGHILLEGVPGLAKTLAIKTLASLISADFGRLQFHPRNGKAHFLSRLPAFLCQCGFHSFFRTKTHFSQEIFLVSEEQFLPPRLFLDKDCLQNILNHRYKHCLTFRTNNILPFLS